MANVMLTPYIQISKDDNGKLWLQVRNKTWWSYWSSAIQIDSLNDIEKALEKLNDR